MDALKRIQKIIRDQEIQIKIKLRVSTNQPLNNWALKNKNHCKWRKKDLIKSLLHEKKNTCPWHFNHFICTLYRIPCLQYSMNSSSRKWNTLLTHIQFCWSGWPRRFGEINVSPHFYFFYCRLSRSQSLIRLFSPPLWSEYLFTLYLVKSGTEASCSYV